MIVLESARLIWTSLAAYLTECTGSKFLSSLRVKTQLLKRPQSVKVVDGATHSEEDGVEGNGGSLKDSAEAFVLFLRGAQLVLRSNFLTMLLS
jgi:hypothetical protein